MRYRLKKAVCKTVGHDPVRVSLVMTSPRRIYARTKFGDTMACRRCRRAIPN